MSMKVSIWKVILTFVFAAVLIVGGILIFRAGFIRGAASNWTLPGGHNLPFSQHHNNYFDMRPFDGRLMVSRFFPGLFLGSLCLGILFILVVVLSIGAARRQLFWQKNGLFDPLNLWEPPPAPEKVQNRDEKTNTSSE